MTAEGGQVTIDKCPICGEEIQATREVWLSNVTLKLTDDGYLEIESDGDLTGESSNDEMSVYCENDHTREDMMDALANR